MTIAGILSACSYNRLYFRAKKAMDSLAVKLFKSSIFSYHFLIVVEILALCNFFLEEKMCHFGQTDCFLKNSSKFVSDFTKSSCENSFIANCYSCSTVQSRNICLQMWSIDAAELFPLLSRNLSKVKLKL